jgi:hypothetical protein
MSTACSVDVGDEVGTWQWHTCQVSRISRETDAFSSNSTVSARMEFISRIFKIFNREKNSKSAVSILSC